MSDIIKSTLPSVDLVTSHLWHFLYSPEFPAGWRNVDPNKPAYIDSITGRSIKFGDMRSLSARLAYAFRKKIGLNHGDTVLVVSHNHVLLPVMIHACVAATLTYTSCSFVSTEEEISHQVSDAGAKAIFCHKDLRDKAIKSAVIAGIPEDKVYCIEDEPETPNSMWSYVDQNEFIPPQMSLEEAKNTTALMCYSSGTSGKPKGVETSHYNWTSVILQTQPKDTDNSKEVYVCFLPLSHMYAVYAFPFKAFYEGATSVVLPGFEMDVVLRTIEKYRVTSVNLVPPIVVGMLRFVDSKKYDLSSVGSIACGAAPLGEDTIEQFEQKFGIPIRLGYGMTEATCGVSAGTITDTGTITKGSNGPILPNMEAKIVNGEIWIRGPNIMKGYFKNEEANKATFTEDGFMKTGDVGHFDEYGNVWVTDRIKELIKYKGFQVAPAELEDLLLKHPDISDVAVVGVPEADLNELPRAYVVLAEGSAGKVSENDIIEWAAQKTAHFKRLRGGVIFRDAVPKSPSGKILRRFLRDEIAAEKAAARKPNL